MTITGFPPLSNSNASVLVLGSMPSIKSLAAAQYYAHPRNAFWPIMMTLFGGIDSADYQQKKDLLLSNKIALWDVLKHCHRPGSMDAAIDPKSVVCNDFKCFFNAHPAISHVCFNGGAAQKIFRQRVAPSLTDVYPPLDYHQLPSTSPAYAAISLAEKTKRWQILKSLIPASDTSRDK